MELSSVNGTVETLWVRIKGQTNDVDVTESPTDLLARMMMSMNYSLRN